MIVKHVPIALLAVFLMSATLGCGETKIAMADAKAKAMIVGTWTANMTDGKVEVVSSQTYKADGTYTTANQMQMKGPDGKAMQSTITESGIWGVRDGILTTTLKETSAPELKKPGFVASSRIVRLDPAALHFVDGSGREINAARPVH